MWERLSAAILNATAANRFHILENPACPVEYLTSEMLVW